MQLAISGNKKQFKRHQRTTDIVKLMLFAEQDSRRYYPDLKKYFDTGDDMETAKKIYQFTQDNLSYFKEPPENQNCKSVARCIADKYNDCKGYSTVILCALRACGIKSNYRFASYNYWDKTPKHVYVIAKIDGQDVPMDGTIRKFGAEAPFKYAYDRKIKNSDMALNYLSGIGATKKQQRKKKKAAKKLTKAQKQAKRQANKATRRAKVAKIAAAPARAAFLALVKLNMFKLSDKLARGYRMNPKKVQDFWNRVGGKWDTLRKTINSKQPTNAQINSVSAAAILAAATPILIMAKSLIQELGLFQGKENEDFDEGIETGIDYLMDDPLIEKQFVQIQEGMNVAAFPHGTSKSITKDEPDTDEDDKTSNMLLYGGLALAAVLVLPKIMKS